MRRSFKIFYYNDFTMYVFGSYLSVKFTLRYLTPKESLFWILRDQKLLRYNKIWFVTIKNK